MTEQTHDTDEQRLTEEDLNALRYFWGEKRDLTRWLGYARRLPVLQRERPDIIEAWNAYLAAERRMSAVLKSETTLPSLVTVEIHRPDDDTLEFRLNGESFATFTPDDSHGRSGMEGAEALVAELARRAGFQIACREERDGR